MLALYSEYNIDLETNVLCQTFAGDIKGISFGSLADEIIDDKDFDPRMNRIYDFTHNDTLKLTTTEIMQVIAESRHWQILPETKIAIIAGNQEDAGLLRIVAASIESFSVKVFRSQNEALNWLVEKAARQVESLSNLQYKTIRFKGPLGLDEILAAQSGLLEKGVGQIPLLWDLREAKLSESIESVIEMAVYIAANHDRDRAGMKSAILVDSHINELLYRKMTTVDNWPKDESKLFRSYKEALNWLAT